MDNLYDDLDVFEDIDVEYKKVQNINKDLSKKIGFLEAEVEKLNEVVLQMKKQQEQLERNISSLYNTAKAECERKDRQIAELQQRLDDVVFRRTDRKDFRVTRGTSRASNRSDSSRSTWRNSRSVSPVQQVRKVQEHRISPRKRINEGSGPRTPPPPSRGGKRDFNKESKVVRNSSTYQEERSRSRKRHWSSESKSSTGKRGRYEGNGRHDNRRSHMPPRKTELTFEKVDRSSKAANNVNNGGQTQKIVKKEEILDDSVEDGEIIEVCEIKEAFVNNTESNNECKNEQLKDVTHGGRARQLNAHQKVENLTKLVQKVDKIVTESEDMFAAEVKNDKGALDKDNIQNPPLDETKKPVEKPAASRKDDYRLLSIEVPQYPESGKTAPEARPDVVELAKNPDIAASLEAVKKQPSPKITSFTGVLNSDEVQRKLFAPKPAKAVAADVLFGANPLVSASRTKTARSERAQRSEPKSAPPTIEHPSNINNSEAPDNADESVRTASRAESKDSASSLDTSLHLCLSSDDNKSTCSNNGDTTVIHMSPRANDKDHKENVQNESVVLSGIVAVPSAPVDTSPVVAGKGIARPRRRRGFVQVMD